MNEAAWILVLVPLALDVFAAGLVFGLAGLERARWVVTALIFAGIGVAMFWLGGLLGGSVTGTAALLLKLAAGAALVAIGANSIRIGLREPDPEDTHAGIPLGTGRVAVTAGVVAVDKLAVAVTLAILGAPINSLLLPLGVLTFAATLLGIGLGSRLGDRVEDAAELIGGAIFVLLGLVLLWSTFAGG